jgi:uncharacterized integral membrane protein
MERVALIIALIVAVLAAALVGAANMQTVQVELALTRLQGPLGLVLVCVFVLGLLLGVLLRVTWVAQLLSERGRLRRALRLAEARTRASIAGDNVG